MSRGRPHDTSNDAKVSKFSVVYENKDGTKDTWTYDLNKQPNGPLSVEIWYPKNYNFGTKEQDLVKKFKNAPLTQRKWMAPSGKLVSYQRAKVLGLIKNS